MTTVTLLQMKQSELDDLYRSSSIGAAPVGVTTGILLFAPATGIGRVLQALTRTLVWQGKVFDSSSGQLVNVVTPFRVRAVHADVYSGPSWMDGEPSTIFDYSKRSWLARHVRDEVREVAPGLFLGKAYWRRRKVIDFVLE
jgi:hypothetical protein